MPDDTIPKSEQEFKDKLTEEQYRVLREAGTEPPFSGKYVNEKTPGVYACAACGNELFSSEHKFDSSSGWPSFEDAREGAVEFREDNSHGMHRTEIVCAKCGSHLGHMFEGDYTPTGEYYCVNSVALDLKEDGSE